MEKFSVKAFLQNVQNESITHSLCCPACCSVSCQRSRNDARSTSIVIRAVYERLKISVRQAFGLTESTAASHMQVSSARSISWYRNLPCLIQKRWDRWDQVMGSSGPPYPQVETKFVDEEGELYLRGLIIFRGYHNNVEATAGSITRDGWFKTGDIGSQDEEGNLFITDRLKDLIKFKDFQIPPTELESVLHGYPLVHDVAVIGLVVQKIASKVLLVAFVVLEETSKPTEQVAKERVVYASGKLAPHKKLRGRIIPIGEVPKGASGKILKRVLRIRAKGVDRGKAIGAALVLPSCDVHKRRKN